MGKAKTPPPDGEPKKPTGWELLVSRLSPAGKAALAAQGEDNPEPDWEAFRARLSAPARAALDAAAPPPDPPQEPPAGDKMRFFLAKFEAGEYPVVISFADAKAWATEVGRLEGKDVAVVPFWGTFLPVSTGPQRFLAMPDRAFVMTVPAGGVGQPRRVDADTVEFDVQEYGYLGDQRMLKRVAPPDASQGGLGDDDDDDDSADDDQGG